MSLFTLQATLSPGQISGVAKLIEALCRERGTEAVIYNAKRGERISKHSDEMQWKKKKKK